MELGNLSASQIAAFRTADELIKGLDPFPLLINDIDLRSNFVKLVRIQLASAFLGGRVYEIEMEIATLEPMQMCNWDVLDNVSACGYRFEFNDEGTPNGNGWEYCPSCGKKINEYDSENHEEPEEIPEL